MFKYQDLQMFGPQIKQIWLIFVVAKDNFKWVKIKII